MQEGNLLSLYSKGGKVSTVRFQVTPQKLDRSRICDGIASSKARNQSARFQIIWDTAGTKPSLKSNEKI